MFKGSMVALVTPMLESGAIDWSSLDGLLELHMAAGTDAVVVLGTTGEAATITRQERTKLIEHVIAKVADKLPVIVGTGGNSTALSCELTAEALSLGATAALVVTPYYNKPTQAGLVQHYAAIAKAAPIPMILYNVPSRTGVDLLPETVQSIQQQIPTVIGVKDAIGGVERLKALQQLGIDLEFYSGDDASALGFLQQGGQGVITVTGNVAPQMFAQMCKSALAGDNADAEKLNQALCALYTALFVESNPIPAKWLLAKRGHITQSALRLPLTELSVPGQEQLQQLLAGCDFK